LSFSWVTLCVSPYDEPSADTSDEKPDEDEAFSDEKPDEDEALSDEKPDEDEAFSDEKPDEDEAFAVQPVSITSAVSTAVIFFLKISLLTLYILAHR
jgi:hypothetical protein